MSTRRIQTAVPRMYGDHSARPLIRRYLAAPLSVRGRHWHRQSQCAAERCLYGRLPQIPRAVAIPEFTFLLMGLGCQSAHRLWRLVDLAVFDVCMFGVGGMEWPEGDQDERLRALQQSLIRLSVSPAAGWCALRRYISGLVQKRQNSMLKHFMHSLRCGCVLNRRCSTQQETNRPVPSPTMKLCTCV